MQQVFITICTIVILNNNLTGYLRNLNIFRCKHDYTHPHTHTHTHTHTYIYIYIYIYIYTNICVCVSVYAYIYIYKQVIMRIKLH